MPRQADIDEANNKKADDPEFKTINWERNCTDKLCCLIFIIFIGSLVVITGYGYTQGDPQKIITPFDSVGNLCGAPDTDYAEYKYKLFTGLPAYMEQVENGGDAKDLKKLLYAACVKTCPAINIQADCVPNTETSNVCPTNDLYGTTLFVNYCFPDKAAGKKALDVIKRALAADPNVGRMTEYFQQLEIVWKEILYMCLASVLITVVYIFLLKWITKPLLYVSMLIILIMFVLLGAWSWQKRTEYAADADAYAKLGDKEKDDYKYATAGAAIAWSVAGLYFLFMCCCWKNIALGATIMEVASDFVSGNLSVITLPLMSYLIVVLFFAYWLTAAVYVYSVGEVEFKQGSFLPNIVWAKETRYILWYFLFGLFWVFSFFICQQQMIIACMTVQWYFSGQEENSDAPGSVGLFKSIKWGMWYHAGTVAFGSFLIAVVTMIRVVFEYLVKQYEASGAKENPVMKAIFCCIRGMLYLLDQYVKFISKSAFIQTAIHNSSFCESAINSFYLIIRHAGRFTSAGSIGFIMMFLGKGTIMSTSAYLTILLIKSVHPDVSQPFLPAFLVAMAAYVVASLFLSIFSFSCTTILHCFIMAEDSPGCQVVSPKGLQAFLDSQDGNNAKPKASKKDTAEANAVE